VAAVAVARRSTTGATRGATTACVRRRRAEFFFHSPCILRVPDYTRIAAWNLRR